MGGLIATWAAAFRRNHPDVNFVIDLKGTATAQFGLQANTADIALSDRPIYPYEYYGIYRRSQLLTVEIPVAIGSYNGPGKSAALAVFVHRDNPLTKLSLSQLDRIFGAERAGGWQGMEWNTGAARRSDRDIRTWGQMGLPGVWANRPIIPYGPPAVHPGGVSFFQSRVMGGADTWNERLREYVDPREMLRAVAGDRFGIGYACLADANPGVKSLALAERDGGSYVPLTAATVAAGSYPLRRYVYFYLAPDTLTGDPTRLSPQLQAFLAFVVSRGGQSLVRLTGYHSLLSKEAGEQARRIAKNALPVQSTSAPD